MKTCFFKNPCKAAKEVITPKKKKEPIVPKSVLNKYVQKVASDPDRVLALKELPILIN